MPGAGWKALVEGFPWFLGAGRYPIAAYSEFMPPPRLGLKPTGTPEPPSFEDSDPVGWPVTEYEEHWELRPGLEAIARQVLRAMVRLGEGGPAHGIARAKLVDNPYWPPELAVRAGSLAHERFVTLLPLALARTQDDKGRLRWTLFGGSEQGPGRAFWRGFRGMPEESALGFFRRLIASAHGEPSEALTDLRRAGFRILPGGEGWSPAGAVDDPLPAWTANFIWDPGSRLGSIRYLLTYRPFSTLPAAVRRAYLAGQLHLLPFPGSLLFWGVGHYRDLQRELPLAGQLPLLALVAKHDGPHGLRVPQTGWMHEPKAGERAASRSDGHHGKILDTYARSHRNQRILRTADPDVVTRREDKLAHVLFSATAEDLGLYGKPMARNAQIWDAHYRLVLDGPRADREAVRRAAAAVAEGGHFGYRFQFPAMRVGRHEIYWHRPLVAHWDQATEAPVVLPDSPLGYLTAYEANQPDPTRPIELWPRVSQRIEHEEAIRLFESESHVHRTARNVRKLLDAYECLSHTLPLTFARRLLTVPKKQTLDGWLSSLPESASAPARGQWLISELRAKLAPESPLSSGSRTFDLTARRTFEVGYWKAIAAVSRGRFLTKNNADCARNPPTQSALVHHRRDLDPLGDLLLKTHAKSIARAGMENVAIAGELPFRWQTECTLDWSDGWLANQADPLHERDLIVVIPGRDRSRTVIMADHYDTAYQEDVFKKKQGARIAAPGADDNGSATAALLRAAPVFLELSRDGRLGCDVWLIHLTGEEFPADCLGARHLAQGLVEGSLAMRSPAGLRIALSGTRVIGAFVLDMVAHNANPHRDVFQIAPGTGAGSMGLALQAHLANESWNAHARARNDRPPRRGLARGRRSRDGQTIPALAPHRPLIGEVRPHDDPRSTLFNSDGQVFSDAGIPVVLFMEDYDINRKGYHDSLDTMANIDLDYGAALVAIAIETVASVAAGG